MKEKGFTLIELVAVIVILGVLVVLVTPAIIGMRNTVINNTLKNKISMIYDAAIDYANDNIMDIPKGIDADDIFARNSKKCYDDRGLTSQEKKEYYKSRTNEDCLKYCYVVLVKTLIDRGYLVGDTDGRTSIENPLTGESMNSELVCVRYDSDDPQTRELIAYILGEQRLWGENEGSE